MVLNTITVGAAVTPAIIACGISHYTKRQRVRQKPTAHISYDEGLHLVRRFILYASHHTVEEIQAFTSQWVPVPRWVKLKEVEIEAKFLAESAAHITKQLGPKGVEAVGGTQWWQWRQGDGILKAEWIEMRSDFNERKKNNDKGSRVILYVHGGAYYFGSVDEHRYQMQRHARKLKARCLAPRYRLSPQFPFPCGLQDCLAAYLYCLTEYSPEHILLAGDSAGGGMTLAMLTLIRDQGIPLPAGALLLSPWVDLTHSFPSLSEDGSFDYIPAYGFHHRPSRSWPAPKADEVQKVHGEALTKSPSDPQANFVPDLSIELDGKTVEIKDQIQMYAPNHLLTHPLVSPVMNPTLGGLPPLLIQAGGGELLRDEQIYLAHKAANPAAHLPPQDFLALTDPDGSLQSKYEPTDVQLQVWDDLCHVAHTLSWTRPAKYMYRAVAQFGAWALARAQHRSIDILDDDAISEISTESDSDSSPETDADSLRPDEDRPRKAQVGKGERRKVDGLRMQKSAGAPLPLFSPVAASQAVGKAGDSLPPFEGHMIRQRVDRHGNIYALAPPSELPGCCMAREQVGRIKEGPVRKFLKAQEQWDSTYAGKARAIRRQREEDMKLGYVRFDDDNERPPPTALAGRRRLDKHGKEIVEKKSNKRSWGMSMWSLWGSKHDEKTIEREQRVTADEPSSGPGRSRARSKSSAKKSERPPIQRAGSSQPSPYTAVSDQGQTTSAVPSPAPVGAEEKHDYLAPHGPNTTEHTSVLDVPKEEKVVESGTVKVERVDGGARPAPERFVTAPEL